MKLSTILIAAATLLATFSLQANDDLKTRADKRQKLQAKRIKHGVKNGELTKRETRSLIKGQRKINRMERRFESDGELSRKEKLRLEKAQNRNSRKIFKKKHNKRDRQEGDRITKARKKAKRIENARKKKQRIAKARAKKKRIMMARRKHQARKQNQTDVAN